MAVSRGVRRQLLTKGSRTDAAWVSESCRNAILRPVSQVLPRSVDSRAGQAAPCDVRACPLSQEGVTSGRGWRITITTTPDACLPQPNDLQAGQGDSGDGDDDDDVDNRQSVGAVPTEAQLSHSFTRPLPMWATQDPRQFFTAWRGSTTVAREQLRR